LNEWNIWLWGEKCSRWVLDETRRLLIWKLVELLRLIKIQARIYCEIEWRWIFKTNSKLTWRGNKTSDQKCCLSVPFLFDFDLALLVGLTEISTASLLRLHLCTRKLYSIVIALIAWLLNHLHIFASDYFVKSKMVKYFFGWSFGWFYFRDCGFLILKLIVTYKIGLNCNFQFD
jgi:hypothetical protein